MSLWWLSFADETGFLGGTVVEAETFVGAVLRTHHLGINPGGEVQGVELVGGDWVAHKDHPKIKPAFEKLVSAADIDKYDKAVDFR